MTRYLSGLCVAGLGLCGGGWLVVAALAFGGESGGRAGRVNLLTGAVLIVVGCLSLACWSCAWRQRLRADGVLEEPFPLVTRREARRNRRALNRDVRRAGRLADRSARSARRAARRSARLAGGAALSEGGVLGEGVALGVASPGDEPSGAAAASYGGGVNGSAANGAAAQPGERAAELISELRSMLEPLLTATGGQPALTEQLAALVGRPAPTASAPTVAAPTMPAPSAPAPAAAAPLPQRTRFASELRPRVTAADLAMPGARSAPMSIPRLAQAAADACEGPASEGEDAWW